MPIKVVPPRVWVWVTPRVQLYHTGAFAVNVTVDGNGHVMLPAEVEWQVRSVQEGPDNTRA